MEADSMVADVVRAMSDAAIYALVRELPEGSATREVIAQAVAALVLGGPAPQATTARSRAPRLPAASPAVFPAATPAKRRAASAALPTTDRKKGEKRSPRALAELTERVFNVIKATPGAGVETLGKALGLKTAEIGLPIKKLLHDGKVTSTGQKRATRYTAV